MTRSFMILGLLTAVAFMAGWFSINREGDRTLIEINRDEIRSDARQAIDRGRDYWEQRRLQEAQRQQQGYAQNPNGGSPWGNPQSPYTNPPVEGYEGSGGYAPIPNYQSQQNGYYSPAGYAPNGWNAPNNGYNPNNGSGAPDPNQANPWGNPPPANWQPNPAGYQGAYGPQQATPAWPTDGTYAR